jgi:hypothetical protein
LGAVIWRFGRGWEGKRGEDEGSVCGQVCIIVLKLYVDVVLTLKDGEPWLIEGL